MTTMPLPANDNFPKDVHPATFPLFNSSSGDPALEEVKQAPNISNCPVASILAAHAFTQVGIDLIKHLVPEPTSANVLTDLSALPSDALENPPPGNTVSSSSTFPSSYPMARKRLAMSCIPRTPLIPAAFFRSINMSDPSDQSIWAAIIEKALAVQIGSYENFDALPPLSANDWWKKITGVLPTGFPVTAGTPLSQIIAAAQASTNVPTIGASRDDLPIGDVVSAFHGYAIIGMQTSKIHLYDPAKTRSSCFPRPSFAKNLRTFYLHHRADRTRQYGVW